MSENLNGGSVGFYSVPVYELTREGCVGLNLQPLRARLVLNNPHYRRYQLIEHCEEENNFITKGMLSAHPHQLLFSAMQQYMP